VTLVSPKQEEIQLTEQEHLRTVSHRRAVLRHAEEVTHNVSLTCRYYVHPDLLLSLETAVRAAG
jgi:hypothetical protein